MSLKYKYKINQNDYDQFLKEQNNCCKICEIDNNFGLLLSVDHNHKTGKVRGLLCQNCNLILGNSKDNIKILEKAIQYLKDNDHE